MSRLKGLTPISVTPISEITDLTGARVVCLYRSDLAKVAEVVRRKFDLIEELDKARELDVDQFSYGAMHFVVRLGKRSAGARYDDLKQLLCEIQIRTVVQDAWAIIQHHLVYKRESQVPTQLQRKLNSLAGLFETVDDQFESIRKERETYLAGVRESVEQPDAFLRTDLNLDSFAEYLNWRFAGRSQEGYEGQLRLVFDKLLAAGIRTLRQLDDAVRRSESARATAVAEVGTSDIKKGPDGQVPFSLEALFAVALATASDLDAFGFSARWKAAIAKYRLRS